MLAAFGGLGIGLVWGWVAVHLLRGARRARALRTLIGLALQVALLRWLGTPIHARELRRRAAGERHDLLGLAIFTGSAFQED